MGQINTGWESDLYNLELFKQFLISRSWRQLPSPEASGYP